MAHSEDVDERGEATGQLRRDFASLSDKEQAWKDLLALAKDDNKYVQFNAAISLYQTLPHVTDKDSAWKDLMKLTQETDEIVQSTASIMLGFVSSHVTDKEGAWKDLRSLTKNKVESVRRGAEWSLCKLALNFLNEKNYEKASECFYGASNKSTLWEYISPSSIYYLNRGLGSYYHGRTIVNELSNVENPKEYTKNLKDAVRLFAKSLKYIEKSENNEYDTSFFPICLNIYSAYYEYNLSFQKTDKKRIGKVKKYLDEASKQCQIIGTEKGERIVKIFEKLKEALTSRLKEIELETEKNKVSGIGKKADYEPFIDKSRKAFEKHIIELENSLDEIELPIIKEIAEHERIKLDKLKPDKAEKLESTNHKFQKKVALVLGTPALMLTISYAGFDIMGYPAARMYSLIVFGLFFILSLIFYSIKR